MRQMNVLFSTSPCMYFDICVVSYNLPLGWNFVLPPNFS